MAVRRVPARQGGGRVRVHQKGGGGGCVHGFHLCLTATGISTGDSLTFLYGGSHGTKPLPGPDDGPPGRAERGGAAAGAAVPVARYTVANLCRAGCLYIVRKRRVAYNNKPVAEYAPAAHAGHLALADALRAWRTA